MPQLMKKCWSAKVSEQPDFGEIKENLGVIMMPYNTNAALKGPWKRMKRSNTTAREDINGIFNNNLDCDDDDNLALDSDKAGSCEADNIDQQRQLMLQFREYCDHSNTDLSRSPTHRQLPSNV